MARIARTLVRGMPHHITQRGNRREQVFFSADDYLAFIEFLARALSNGRTSGAGPPIHAHFGGRGDAITTVEPVLSRMGAFADFLDRHFDDRDFDPIRRAEQIGRQIGSACFIAGLEANPDGRERPANGKKSGLEGVIGLHRNSNSA